MTGKSARHMLVALVALVAGTEDAATLVAGTEDAATLADLAELAEGRLRQKLPHLTTALAGRFGSHQRCLVLRQPPFAGLLHARRDPAEEP